MVVIGCIVVLGYLSSTKNGKKVENKYGQWCSVRLMMMSGEVNCSNQMPYKWRAHVICGMMQEGYYTPWYPPRTSQLVRESCNFSIQGMVIEVDHNSSPTVQK